MNDSEVMLPVKILNKEILQILNEFKDCWYTDIERLKKNVKLDNESENRDEWISDKKFHQIYSLYDGHDGYPEKLKGYNFRNHLGKRNIGDPYFSQQYIALNAKLQILLATKANALCVAYPPGGFISWHNNANAAAYNLIFTWSETGDGYWRHYDPNKKEIVTIQDVPGWQCKASYFGSYRDNLDDVVYHMASTDCWRMTISYVFDTVNEQFWKDMIEEIEIE